MQEIPAVPEYQLNLASDFAALSQSLAFSGKFAEGAAAAEKGVAMMRQMMIEFPKVHRVSEQFVRCLIRLSRSMEKSQQYKKAEEAAREALAKCEHISSGDFNADVGCRSTCGGSGTFRSRIAHSSPLYGIAANLSQANRRIEPIGGRTSKREQSYFPLCIGHFNLAQALNHGQRDGDAATSSLKRQLTYLKEFRRGNKITFADQFFWNFRRPKPTPLDGMSRNRLRPRALSSFQLCPKTKQTLKITEQH